MELYKSIFEDEKDKLNGYAPKYSLEYLKNMRTEEKQKASHSKNDLQNGGGEGGIRTHVPAMDKTISSDVYMHS